jgi:hypothetical protein
MSIDFVQLRWQQVRAVEAAQVIETDNVDLRKRVLQLQKDVEEAETSSAKNNANKGVELLAIKKHCQSLKTFSMRTQSEILKLKLTFIQEMGALANQKNLLAQAFENLMALLKAKEGECLSERRLKEQLEDQLEDLRDHGESSDKSHSQEVQKIRAKYQAMKASFKESQEKMQSLIAESESHERTIAALQAEKAEALQQRDKAQAETKAVAAALEQFRTDTQVELEGGHEGRQAMQAHYEQIIDQLGYENEYLRATCTDQEAQIERLTNSLIGNKSHFARYVEVKTENLTLQSKLKGFEGPVSTFSSKRPAVGGSVVSTKGNVDTDFSALYAAAPGLLPAHRKRASTLLAAAGASAFDGGAGGAGGGNLGIGMRGQGPQGSAASVSSAAGPASAQVRDILDVRIPGVGTGLPPPQPSITPAPAPAAVSPQTSPRSLAPMGVMGPMGALPTYLPAAKAIKPLSTKASGTDKAEGSRRASFRPAGGLVGTALGTGGNVGSGTGAGSMGQGTGGSSGSSAEGDSPRSKKSIRIQPVATGTGAAAGAVLTGAMRSNVAHPAPGPTQQPRSIRFAEGVGAAAGGEKGDKVVVGMAESGKGREGRERPGRDRQVQVF